LLNRTGAVATGVPVRGLAGAPCRVSRSTGRHGAGDQNRRFGHTGRGPPRKFRWVPNRWTRKVPWQNISSCEWSIVGAEDPRMPPIRNRERARGQQSGEPTTSIDRARPHYANPQRFWCGWESDAAGRFNEKRWRVPRFGSGSGLAFGRSVVDTGPSSNPRYCAAQQVKVRPRRDGHDRARTDQDRFAGMVGLVWRMTKRIVGPTRSHPTIRGGTLTALVAAVAAKARC